MCWRPSHTKARAAQRHHDRRHDLRSLKRIRNRADCRSYTKAARHPAPDCNPCTIHPVGEFTLRAFHAFTIMTCQDELTATINANGSGEVTKWIGVDHPVDGACTREQCEGDPDPETFAHWPFTMEEVGLNEVQLNATFCLTGRGTDHSIENGCTVPVHVTEEVSQNHHYFFDLLHECDIGGTPVEVAANWETEAVHNPLEEQEIEILHAP